MNFKNKIFIGCALFLFLSCASTKLMDSWKGQSFDNLSTAKILVISQSLEENVRISYEKGIANRLRAKNIDAIESHVLFPSLKEAETTEEQNQIVKQFREAGISAIVLTSLKQTIETQNRDLKSQTKIPKGYEDKMSFGGNTMNTSTSALPTSKTYVLEGLIYDLTLPEDEQLVNVCLVDVTDPESGDKIEKTFTKIITDQFK